MDYELNETQRAIQSVFKDFVDRNVVPVAGQIDEEKVFPKDLFLKVGEMGFFGMRYPEEAGGTGNDIVSYCAAVIELSRGSASLAAACTMQSLMATYFLYRFGNDQIKDNYFARALSGEKIGGICMTEPNCGTDLKAIKTTAKVGKEGYRLSGQKMWVTSAPVADFLTVLAKTDNHDGLSTFFVPTDLAGVQIGKTIDKLGVCGSPTSEVYFDDVNLPLEFLLGEIGQGTICLQEILAEIRVMTAAIAIGIGTAAFEDALEYAKTRTAFGKPIGKFQAIKMQFAEMALKLESAKRMLFHTASLCDRDLPRAKEASMVKLYASEAAAEVCDQASRVLASYGYAMEYSQQRYLRDIRFTLIGGGTSEILKIQIAKEIGL
ncbi:MAG: acyl-CoA dehydrogenase [Proteobacteria bacterium]|nr:acyl-CoA dehydrogenase [Pseudomonadota bacterium]